MRDIPCTAQLAAPPVSQDEHSNKLFQMCIAFWECGRIEPGMEGPAEMEIGPQMLTVSGGKPGTTVLGSWKAIDRRR